MKTALVTGASGFLGQAIVRHFFDERWTVVGVGRGTAPDLQYLHAFHALDLPSPQLSDLLAATKPVVIVHCAGRASVPMSFENPAQDFHGGPVVVFDLLDKMRRICPRARAVFLSSAAVYGLPRRLPTDEDDVLMPVSPYGHHKMMAEQICREFADLFSLRTSCLRVFSAYGAGLRRQVLWDICGKATQDAEVVLQGTGAETRDFIHASDVARAVFQVALQAPLHGEAYNVASGVETRIDEIARQMVARLCPGKPIRHTGVLPAGTPPRWRADISRLQRLGFQASVAVTEGVNEVVNWFQQEVTPGWRQKCA